MNQNHNDACAICSQEPEDMLLLQCNHNLCLDCATQLFAASHLQSLQCQICFIQTILDKDTINCLSSLAVQANHINYRRQQVIYNKKQSITIPKPPKQVKGLQCFEHKQKALYYCFDCQNGNICSQCILGTSHSGHKVFTVKKATKILAEHLIQNCQQLQDAKSKIQEDVEWVRIKKDEMISQLAQKQNKLKLIFDDLLRLVGERYNELCVQLERSSLRGIQIIDGSFNSMNEKLIFIETTIQQNKLVLSQNDSQQILRRFTQLQLQKDKYKPEMPLILPQNSLSLSHQDAIFVELQSLLQKITWNDSLKSYKHKENRQQFNKLMMIDGSLLEQSRQKIYYQPELEQNHLRQKQMNQSLNKYSGIKMSSRRLELSRSMDNATNIINKLQERIRK